MAAQLDILALEPFYGGGRRAMLQVLRKCSRHRWTLLKLPPRRMDRRLSASANWFAEQLVQHFSGNIDVLFTSEAMNLGNLLRLVPELASKPSVVYFHDNHLPEPACPSDRPFDLVNLNTAMAAGEIWFNSHDHQRDFLERAAALVARYPELSSIDPMPSMGEKSRVLMPPTDLKFAADVRAEKEPARRPDTIFVETRDADMTLLNEALEILSQTRQFRLVTVGPTEALSNRWERKALREADEWGQTVGMLESAVFLSVKPKAKSDHLFVRAMLADCRPMVPESGVYPEMIPASLKPACFYEVNSGSLADRIASALDGATDWHAHPPDWPKIFAPYEAISACRKIDQCLERLAEAASRVTANC